MTMNTAEGVKRYLRACRVDIAHLIGATDADIQRWVDDHLAAGIGVFNAEYVARTRTRDPDELGEDGMSALEGAFLAVKKWAQPERQ
jgi:hypothetical protein